MKQKFNQRIIAACAVLFLAARILAADTNSVGDTNSAPAFTRDEMQSSFLQIQEQLHAAQLALEQNQQAALEASQSNAAALAARLQSLEQTVAAQRTNDADAAQKARQTMLIMAAVFGLIGLGIMFLMLYFQWRAFAQLAQISSQPHAAMSNGDAVHQLATPGRAAVEASTAQLMNVISRLEQRINELETGQRLLPEIAAEKAGDLLADGQKFLDANLPLKALECFDKFLTDHPDRADAMVKRAAALEKLGRDDDALAGYNRAIAMDSSLVIAHLHKGGLLNRLRRYDEALNCYEQALVGQDKRAKT